MRRSTIWNLRISKEVKSLWNVTILLKVTINKRAINHEQSHTHTHIIIIIIIIGKYVFLNAACFYSFRVFIGWERRHCKSFKQHYIRRRYWIQANQEVKTNYILVAFKANRCYDFCTIQRWICNDSRSFWWWKDYTLKSPRDYWYFNIRNHQYEQVDRT